MTVSVSGQSGSSLLQIQDPSLHWSPLSGSSGGSSEVSVEDPAARWLDWLADTGSLTARLKALSDGQFRVQVEQEDWRQIADAGLRAWFGPVHQSHRFWSRHVTLHGHGEPWVIAHTLIPEHSLVGGLAEVFRLADRPLGEYLFRHPELLRATLEITPAPGQSWGRRSLFYLHRKPVMVAEFFLPRLLEVTTGASAATGGQ